MHYKKSIFFLCPMLISVNDDTCRSPGLIPHTSNATVISDLFRHEHLKKAASKRIRPKDKKRRAGCKMVHCNCSRFKALANLKLVAVYHFSLEKFTLRLLLLFDSRQIVWTHWQRFDVVKQHVFPSGPVPILFWWGYKLASAACTDAEIQYQMEFKNWVSGLTARFVLKPLENQREQRALLQR